jgi:hypothetical protein
VSEWIGLVGRLRRVLYGRMEEVSFRTGAATVAGVCAVAATAILLTLTQGGHHAGSPRAQAGLASSSIVAAPATVPLSPSASHRSRTRRPEGGPEVRYVPGPVKTPTARPQPAPSPRPTPMRTFWTNRPGKHGTPSPGPTLPMPFPSPSLPFNQGLSPGPALT